MNKKQISQMLSYYAKLLLITSIILISYGFFLQIKDSSKVLKPIADVEVEDTNSVSVTPVDESSKTSTSHSTEEESQTRASDVPETIPIPKTKEANSILRNEIESKFNVAVFYGKETDGYQVFYEGSNIKASSIYDENIIYNQLNKLNDTLSLYPDDMFEEIKEGGIPLSIYLVASYSDTGITGITDSSNSFANISIAALYPFEESFYHESYHYIERYMFKKGASFSSWNLLNPRGFQYGTVRKDWSYANTFSATAPFVNNYAQTAAAEDRASTFEYMMASSKASCLNKESIIWKKAQYMALMIETVLDSVKTDNTEYWERYL